MYTNCFIPKTTQQLEKIESLGLKSEWLQDIGRKALAAYNQTTTHDATTAPGSYAYFAAVRALRDILCPEGWQEIVHKNVEMVANPDNGVSIMVSSGNKDTGKENGKPKTKNQKGNQTKKFVSFNNLQRYLPTMEQEITNISLSNIWILLFHVDTKKSELRIELSLPIEMDIDDLRVSKWYQRIIIDSIDFSNTPKKNDLYVDFAPESTIELERKSNG